MQKKGLIMGASALLMTMGLMSACGNGEGALQSAAEATDAQEGVAVSENTNSEDMAEIQVVCMVAGTVPSGTEAVETAINAITEEAINTHVHLNLLETGAYAQQMNLMLSSNETIDLMVTLPGGPCSFSTMASQSQLMDIGALASEYAPGVLEEQKDVLATTTVNGKLYGIPANKAFVTAVNIYMRTDVLEDLGLLEKAQNMTTFTEYEEILEAVKNSERWNYLSGVAANGSYGEMVNIANSLLIEDAFADCSYYDNLGDNMSIVGVRNGDDTARVFNFFGSEEYKTMCDISKEWYDKGYIYQDAMTTQETAPSLVKSDVVFSFLAQTEIGSENAVSITCDRPMTTVRVVELPIAASAVTKFVWAVPVTAKEPEAAMAFFNLAYSDVRIADLLAWGIEGVDYEIKENGTAGYIEGNETPAYHTGDTCWPNKLITTPWENDRPTLRDEQREARANAKYSPYMGFACDTSSISTEIGAVSSAIEEYKTQLNAGMAPEGAWEAFNEKLTASGVDVILKEYQAQLDAWLAQKP